MACHLPRGEYAFGPYCFAVTRERIRQIEAKALRKLRRPVRSLTLKSFLEYGHEGLRHGFA